MIDAEVRKRLEAEIAAAGRDMKEVSLTAGLGETYVRDVLKRGRGKIENVAKVFATLGIRPDFLLEDQAGNITVVEVKEMGAPTSRAKAQLNHYKEQIIRAIPDLDKSKLKFVTASAERPTFGSPLPVLGAGRAGDDGRLIYNGEAIEWVPRPPMLEGVEGAYATYVAGDSMKPRFKEGEKVWVHPRRMAKSGDDVVVQLTPKEDGEPPEGYIKEFRRWSGPHLVLYQHNPAGEFSLSRDEVYSVHVIIGSLYV